MCVIVVAGGKGLRYTQAVSAYRWPSGFDAYARGFLPL